MADQLPQPALQIRLLGGFELRVGSHLVGDEHWPLRKARSVVKLLALAERHRLPCEQITEWLWPDLDPASARNNLRQAVHVARRVLLASDADARRWIVRTNDHLALAPDEPAWVDVDAFESAAAAARGTRDAAVLETALALYAGPLLPDDPYEEWTMPRREALRMTYLDLLDELAGAQEAEGDLGAAIATLDRLVRDEPSSEPAHVRLMRLHARTGDRPRAAEQYHRLQESLRALGMDPSPASAALHRAITAGEYPPPRRSPKRLASSP